MSLYYQSLHLASNCNFSCHCMFILHSDWR